MIGVAPRSDRDSLGVSLAGSPDSRSAECQSEIASLEESQSESTKASPSPRVNNSAVSTAGT